MQKVYGSSVFAEWAFSDMDCRSEGYLASYCYEIRKGVRPSEKIVLKWFKEVTLDSELLQVDITLDKNVTEGKLTVSSQPASAEVYIDEEYIGRTPVMVKRPYGDYVVRVSMDGYPDVIDVVSVKGADVSYIAKLTLEDE